MLVVTWNIFFIGITGIDKIALKIRFIEIQNLFSMKLIMPDVTDAASQLKVLTRMDLTVSCVVTVSSLGSFVRMSLWHIVNNTLDNNTITPPPPSHPALGAYFCPLQSHSCEEVRPGSTLSWLSEQWCQARLFTLRTHAVVSLTTSP